MRTLSLTTILFIAFAFSVSAQSLVVNEIVAKNNTGITDEAGQHEDWVEILNTSTSPVLLDGLFLTDKLTNLAKWAIPAGYTIQPGGTLLVWLDEDGTDGPLHANFKLNAAGEMVAIVAADGITIIDSVTFGPQIADVSFGRLYDGGVPWVTYVQPTPYALNQPTSCGLRLFSADDPTLHTMTLDAPAGVSIGQGVTIESRLGPAYSTAILAVGAFGGSNAIPGTSVTLLIGGSATPMATSLADAAGAADFVFGLPNIPALAGITAYLQIFAADATATLFASNALEIVICP